FLFNEMLLHYNSSALSRQSSCCPVRISGCLSACGILGLKSCLGLTPLRATPPAVSWECLIYQGKISAVCWAALRSSLLSLARYDLSASPRCVEPLHNVRKARIDSDALDIRKPPV